MIQDFVKTFPPNLEMNVAVGNFKKLQKLENNSYHQNEGQTDRQTDRTGIRTYEYVRGGNADWWI